ncbi:hypothetical protein [Geodermatophilus sp. CPCC 205761]|uniref:hypothetical protein n=1 Tax=Geodermatophilus sp. CPCC 205761 TaxID=2936597 RepID=UPI003EEB6186
MTATRVRPQTSGARRSRPGWRRAEHWRRAARTAWRRSEQSGRRPAAVDEDVAAGDALPQVLTTVGAVIAPTTAITALLLYFGRQHANAFFGYFGVNFTVLDLTPNDFLVRSADGLFMPIAVAASCALGGLWAHRFAVRRLPRDRRRAALGRAAPVVGGFGGLLVAVAAVAVVRGPGWPRRFPEAGGLALSIGVVLLVYAVHLARQARDGRRGPGLSGSGLAEWAAAFVLITVGLFWAVSTYARGVGLGRAAQLEEGLAGWPDAVVFSERDLRIDVPGVDPVTCADPEGAYRFRYDGLKLVQQAGDHYLLLPEAWAPESGAAVLLPRTDAVRLEFALPGREPPAAC